MNYNHQEIRREKQRKSEWEITQSQNEIEKKDLNIDEFQSTEFTKKESAIEKFIEWERKRELRNHKKTKSKTKFRTSVNSNQENSPWRNEQIIIFNCANAISHNRELLAGISNLDLKNVWKLVLCSYLNKNNSKLKHIEANSEKMEKDVLTRSIP